MSNNDEKTLKKFWEIIVGAGKFATRDELVSHIETNAEAIDEGSLATMRLLAAGSIHMENAFTVLDSAKAIATKNLIFRAAATRAGKHYDMILNRLDPGHVSFYLKSKPHPTAIVSFHFIGRDRLSILLAANTPTESGIRGFGDVYYDCIWLDGIQHKFAATIEEYAVSVNRGTPNHNLIRIFFDFIASAVFFLLNKPKPKEVSFIPHKLLQVLPLHAISFELGDNRIYLHDIVESIHYASSFTELAYAGISFSNEDSGQKRHPHYLSVIDTKASLPSLDLERKFLEVSREQLEPKGVAFDIITDPSQLPVSHRDYIWVTWSSHAKSSANEWGDSYLMLGEQLIRASIIASEWQFDLKPTVILAACESAIDISGGFHIDEYCGLDLAFRIAGARTAVASLWPVDDRVAALTAMLVTAWWFQGRLPPYASVTAIQRALRDSTWKQFLLREDQLRQLPNAMANAIFAVQDPFWKLADDAFNDENSWAPFRVLG